MIGSMSGWHGYPKVWQLGHPKAASLFQGGPVLVQEKYDGSQFSFVYTDFMDGAVLFRSRRQVFRAEEAEKIFKPAVDHVMANISKLHPNWTYRAEAFQSQKHNTLRYGRAPLGNMVLYDIEIGYCDFLEHDKVQREAIDLGVEPVYNITKIEEAPNTEWLEKELNQTSSLEGVSREGLVFKNYQQFTPEGHVMMAKVVGDDFREKHRANKDWSRSRGDFLELMGAELRTEARFEKAVQHLRDMGLLQNGPEDIGPLMRELNMDLTEEHQEELKERLWKKWRSQVLKSANRGFAEWYKRRLTEEAVTV